jgi:hypothetical protein
MSMPPENSAILPSNAGDPARNPLGLLSVATRCSIVFVVVFSWKMSTTSDARSLLLIPPAKSTMLHRGSETAARPYLACDRDVTLHIPDVALYTSTISLMLSS